VRLDLVAKQFGVAGRADQLPAVPGQVCLGILGADLNDARVDPGIAKLHGSLLSRSRCTMSCTANGSAARKFDAAPASMPSLRTCVAVKHNQPDGTRWTMARRIGPRSIGRPRSGLGGRRRELRLVVEGGKQDSIRIVHGVYLRQNGQRATGRR